MKKILINLPAIALIILAVVFSAVIIAVLNDSKFLMILIDVCFGVLLFFFLSGKEKIFKKKTFSLLLLFAVLMILNTIAAIWNPFFAIGIFLMAKSLKENIK
ncbi:hypothetical protein IPJ63_02580 [Candidatus Nomurabacteria bacterium]|nr:MAG: hypothetical protein IPJ63_02580 [Candidatus Nomurabacteria bacterium]